MGLGVRGDLQIPPPPPPRERFASLYLDPKIKTPTLLSNLRKAFLKLDGVEWLDLAYNEKKESWNIVVEFRTGANALILLLEQLYRRVYEIRLHAYTYQEALNDMREYDFLIIERTKHKCEYSNGGICKSPHTPKPM